MPTSDPLHRHPVEHCREVRTVLERAGGQLYRDDVPGLLVNANLQLRPGARLVQRSELRDLPFHDIRAKALTDAKRLRGLDLAQAPGGHEHQSTTEGYVKARGVTRTIPLR